MGIGRCIKEGVGLGISEEEAEYLLEQDLIRVEKELTESFDWYEGLDQCRNCLLYTSDAADE